MIIKHISKICVERAMSINKLTGTSSQDALHEGPFYCQLCVPHVSLSFLHMSITQRTLFPETDSLLNQTQRIATRDMCNMCKGL